MPDIKNMPEKKDIYIFHLLILLFHIIGSTYDKNCDNFDDSDKDELITTE